MIWKIDDKSTLKVNSKKFYKYVTERDVNEGKNDK